MSALVKIRKVKITHLDVNNLNIYTFYKFELRLTNGAQMKVLL